MIRILIITNLITAGLLALSLTDSPSLDDLNYRKCLSTYTTLPYSSGVNEYCRDLHLDKGE